MLSEFLGCIDRCIKDPVTACSVLLVCMIFDFITGIYSAYMAGESIKSGIMRRGLVDKFKWIIGLTFGYAIQLLIDYNGIALAVVGFGITTEVLSIFENFKKMGIWKGVEEFEQESE